MALKKTGISLDLIIHPGETIADILRERDITQLELAVRTGVTPAYISTVVSGKKDISSVFAVKLEYALGVPKSFWLTLQANYEAELLEYYEGKSVTEEEIKIYRKLSEITEYLISKKMLPSGLELNDTIISLRKCLQISNLQNLKNLHHFGAFKMMEAESADSDIIGAWLRICQIGAKNDFPKRFSNDKVPDLLNGIKSIMNVKGEMLSNLKLLMAEYGIDFDVLQRFRGAPVSGYISRNSNDSYRMVLTNTEDWGSFRFSLLHEIGHIVNGDIDRIRKFIDIDSSEQSQREKKADCFATEALKILEA